MLQNVEDHLILLQEKRRSVNNSFVAVVLSADISKTTASEYCCCTPLLQCLGRLSLPSSVGE